jgi:hypothetical protein
MASNRVISPTYSHGGLDVVNFSAVVGNSGALTSGRPISVVGAIHHWSMRPSFMIYASGTSGSCVVAIEANGGTVDPTTFQPPSGEWVDTTNGGISMTFGEKTAKKIMISMPYWRTRLVSCSGNISLISYIPHIHIYQNNGIQWSSAGYPNASSDATYGM